MDPDVQARETFNKLLSNILDHVRSVPAVQQDAVLTETRDALQSIATRHGLSRDQAARWAEEIDQELRFRLLYDSLDVSNDNGG